MWYKTIPKSQWLKIVEEFRGVSVIRTIQFHCHGLGSILGQGTKILRFCKLNGVTKSILKIKQNSKFILMQCWWYVWITFPGGFLPTDRKIPLVLQPLLFQLYSLLPWPQEKQWQAFTPVLCFGADVTCITLIRVHKIELILLPYLTTRVVGRLLFLCPLKKKLGEGWILAMSYA